MTDTIEEARKKVERLVLKLERFEGHPLIENVADDDAKALRTLLAATQPQALGEVVEVLKFYRDQWRWYPVGDEGDGVTEFPRLTGYEAEPKQPLIDDGGQKADALLSKLEEPNRG